MFLVAISSLDEVDFWDNEGDDLFARPQRSWFDDGWRRQLVVVDPHHQVHHLVKFNKRIAKSQLTYP